MLSYITNNVDLWVEGSFNTITLTILSFIIGFFVAVPIGMARVKTGSWLSWLANGYITLIRGTPLLVQIFLLYYGSGQFSRELKQIDLWWLFRDAYYCGLMALVLNTAAYQAEILRGAIQAIPKGLREAGAAIGLSLFKIYRKIILPIALARMLPAMGNELVLLLKASALVSIITVMDVMGQARYLFSQTLDLSVYYLAALIYLAVVLVIEAVWRKLEARNSWLNI